MKKNMLTKRMLSLVLAVAMLASLAACGKAPAETMQNPAEDSQYSREDKELIAELMGGQEAVEQLSDPELDALVEELTKDLEDQQTAGIVNLGETQEKDLPTVDNLENKDAYDENGAMKEPFDQVYPELIEEGKVEFSDESLLIKLSSDTLTDGLKAAGVGALEEIVPMEGAAWYEAKLVEGTDAQKALAAVRELDEVLMAEYDYQVKTAALDDYKHFDKDKEEEFKKNGHNKDQWHFHHCGIPDGYEEMEKDGGDSSVIVAVIDSGVDYDHEDLIDNMWVNSGETPDNGRDDDGNGYVDDYYGVDIIAGKGNGDDTNGHGTHVAGIIAAKNNNTGVLGVAYNVKIMSVKAAMHNGTLNQSDIAKAILYAYNMGAEVINMSFGGTASSVAVQDALATAYTRCVLVASAGNSGKPNEPTDFYPALPNYPAALSYVLGVMSVDQYGMESSFTNWDAYAFNGVEYELYAPGENIMSTLPDNQYGFLSGTSMAAPVVSAFAAILRSEFADRDKYPTKFIYGQLASTSGHYADCVNPQMHTVGGMPHNLPQIVNLNDALTKLPKPEVNLQDYALFDDPALSDKNNGDGVIDAGETIALGLTLRNRWGMSENTQVTIDTLSASSGLADPYFTIENPTVNYGSVGTYSTQDAGRIYTDELLTGWEKPFIIKVSEDCPNDYRFTLNVTVKCENALDEKDETVYTTTGSLNENVRAGYILPSIIEEDMVLTPENLYIIPNATVIREGVTVRVEPGTHIQFWSDDPNDPYADSYIAYLVVSGRFLVEGTKEDPVYIYPSDLMDNYNVEIGATDSGYVSLKYADITNLGHYWIGSGSSNTNTGNRINLADHCTFRMNYPGEYYNYYRSLSGGTVSNSSLSSGTIGNINARDCVFYKLTYNNPAYLNGSFDRCIFNQCGIDYTYNSGNSYKNCVFLGNSYQTANGSYRKSSYTVYSNVPSIGQVYYSPETGTSYITTSGYVELTQKFLSETLEMESVPYVILKNPEAAEALARARFPRSQYNGSYGDSVAVGIRYDAATGSYLWSDGSAIDSWMDPDGLMEKADQNLYLRVFVNKTSVYNAAGSHVGYDYQYGCELTKSYSYYMYEVPGPILPTDITFREYTVAMDMETTYQLTPQNTPVQLPVDSFLYESSDETVLTVSDTGLVTPVGLGTADVWVWSLDKAVKNRVTFEIKDYVPLEAIAFTETALELAVGDTAALECVLYPADTTRRHVTYTSSDEGVVTVEGGVLRATGKGVATVTATCEDVTATMTVTTWVRPTKLQYKTSNHTRAMEDRDFSLPELTVSPANADLKLEWKSDNTSILTVEDGKLILKKPGSTYLRVTEQRTGLTTSFYITVTGQAPVIDGAVLTAQLSDGTLPLPGVTMKQGTIEAEPVWKILDPAVAELKDGTITLKGAGITTLRVTDPRSGLTDEIFLYVTEGETPRIKELQVENLDTSPCVYALTEDGDLYYWYLSGSGGPYLLSTGVKAFDNNYGYVTVLLEDGTIQVYSGTSVKKTITALQGMPVKGIANDYNSSTGTSYNYCNHMFALMEDGTVYAMGKNGYGQLGIGTKAETAEFTKVLLNEPVAQVAVKDYITYYRTEAGNLYISGGYGMQAATPIMIARNVTWLDGDGEYFITDHHLATFAYDATEPWVSTDSLEGYAMLDMHEYGSNSSSNYGVAEKDGKLYIVYNSGSVGSVVLSNTGKIVAGGLGHNNNNSSNYLTYYALTAEGLLFASGQGIRNAFMGMTTDTSRSGTQRPVFLPIVQPEETLNLLETNLQAAVLREDTLTVNFNKQLLGAKATIYENGTAMVAHTETADTVLYITPSLGFAEDTQYKVVISASGTTGVGYVHPAEDITLEFTYSTKEVPEETAPEETVPETTEPEITEPTSGEDIGLPLSLRTKEKTPVVYEAIVDETVVRHWTTELLSAALTDWLKATQLNGYFYGNAILNPISTDTEVTHWLRFQARELSTVGGYAETPLGGNWWGSTNETAIGLQLIDYADFPNYYRLMYAPYLTEAPENTFPFVTSVKLFNKDGEEVTVVGNEQVTFQVKFNRDMDTTIPLQVRFGSAYPYGDYEVEGQYVDERTWEGVYTLNTIIENGYQYFSISNGCSATEDLELQWDQYRFFFEIDTTAAQALIMQGNATDTGIELKWTQDDFKTLMGYNVYRSTSLNGQYKRLNSTVIPADTMTWFDDTVEPGKVYYYNFTVVQTDLAESEPSGKISLMSKDTMAPNVYHSPVQSAFTGENLVISATVTDNLNIIYANLYYRTAGTEQWKTVRMNALNDKYSAILPAGDITLAGVEYYIEAFDGVSFTYRGSAEAPFVIAVREALDKNSLGDVDGNGTVTVRDALMLLQAISHKYNMKEDEFIRADLNGDGQLSAVEALRILHYVSGKVGSLAM